jgi:predicted nucleic acid-binding protein
VTVLDAQPLVAALTGEAGVGEVEALLRRHDDPPRVSTLALAEVLDVLVRRRGVPLADATERLAWLQIGGLVAVPVDEQIGLLAGEIHARHFDPRGRAVSLADCVTLATALTLRDRLATADRALLAMASDEGCAVIALPAVEGYRSPSK